MNETLSYHMTPDEFRRNGRAVVDWIADYYERVEQFPVLSPGRTGRNSRRPCRPPHRSRARTLPPCWRMWSELILPGITHWQSPNFFAFFPANTSGPAILGELLSAGLGVQGMLWATSPACTELETHVLDWVVALLDLPANSNPADGGWGYPGLGLQRHLVRLAGCPGARPWLRGVERAGRNGWSPTLPARRTPRWRKRPRSPAWAARICA